MDIMQRAWLKTNHGLKPWCLAFVGHTVSQLEKIFVFLLTSLAPTT